MADSATNLDNISASQASKEVTANALYDAGSPATLYGRRASTTSGLTFGYYGGKFRREDGTIASIANGTITLTNNATNYLYANGDGVVTKVTSAPTGWPGPLSFGSPAEDAIALYQIVVSGGAVTSYTDYRTTDYGRGGSSSISSLPNGGTAGQVLVKDSGVDYDASWASPPIDISAFYPGAPTASAKILRIPVARAVTFPANFSGSYAKAGTAATGSTAFDVQKNGGSIGTITFDAAGSSATFTTSGGTAQTLAAGDVLAIIAPGSADATLADIGFTLAGTR